MNKKYIYVIYTLMTTACACAFYSCAKKPPDAPLMPQDAPLPAGASSAAARRHAAERAMEKAGIPAALAKNALDAHQEGAFFADLEAVLAEAPSLRQLVDKAHPLSPLTYEPDDLVTLRDGAYRTGRVGLCLRREAQAALDVMAQTARAGGVTLVVSSAYRSYDYQVEVYARNVRESGQETADRESARPGYSQHQSGLAADFGSITDAFAQTAAGKWMLNNAAAFGWSLSFPDGYEALTGYRWESWHYRYTGAVLARFIERWFGGIQQYALQFIYEWERL